MDAGEPPEGGAGAGAEDPPWEETYPGGEHVVVVGGGFEAQPTLELPVGVMRLGNFGDIFIYPILEETEG